MIDLVPWEVMTKISEVKLGALNYHNELIFFFFGGHNPKPVACNLLFIFLAKWLFFSLYIGLRTQVMNLVRMFSNLLPPVISFVNLGMLLKPSKNMFYFSLR